MPAQDIATGHYLTPAVMTAPGAYGPLLAGLPPGIAAVAEAAHGLLIHEHMAGSYGVTLTPADRASVHVRPVAGLLQLIAARDSRPLTDARVPVARRAGNCRHFTVLAVAALRAQGTPARARCGFGAYFVPGRFEDHWVCEFWDAARQRWVLADAQIDALQRDRFGIGFDVLDVPRDQFLIAGDAWTRFRAGHADPGDFGLSVIGESGDWWIAANLMRDAAALCGMEMLPWDVWGAMPGPGDEMGPDLLALFDRLAVLTTDPDASLEPLRACYDRDDRLRVPPVVRNALRGRGERV